MPRGVLVPFICHALHHTAHHLGRCQDSCKACLPKNDPQRSVRPVQRQAGALTGSIYSVGKACSPKLGRDFASHLVQVFQLHQGEHSRLQRRHSGLEPAHCNSALKSGYHAGAGLNLLQHLMTEMQLGVMQPGHACMYLHDARPQLLFQQHASLAVLRLSGLFLSG